MLNTTPSPTGATTGSAWVVFVTFLRLGLTSFGGPIAHLGYFREALVSRQRWLSEQNYADLVALCQFLPGPASSQVGIALGLSRAGYAGAIAAWLGFTLPSALLLMTFALGLAHADALLSAGVLQGLKLVAVAVVAQAVWGMGRSLCPDKPRLAMMVVATAVLIVWPGSVTQLLVIVGAGLAGLWLFTPPAQTAQEPLPVVVGRRAGAVWLLLFFVGLLGLPLLATLAAEPAVAMVDAFYRAGALVFGGGHVVLPMLQAEVVPTGWVDADRFLAGYGAAQAVPGPLFTFAAFLGASMQNEPSGWLGGLLCLSAIFLPSFLLVFGVLPFWESLRRSANMRAALMGINAAVVGLLLAALYDPVWTGTVYSLGDVCAVLVALAALMRWRLPPWLVVIASAALGWLFSVAA